MTDANKSRNQRSGSDAGGLPFVRRLAGVMLPEVDPDGAGGRLTPYEYPSLIIPILKLRFWGNH